MTDWKSVVERNDTVETPQGIGVVKRISEANGTAHVEVGTQLFEIPLSDIKQAPSPQPNGGGQGEQGEFKKGDVVAKKDNPKSTGRVKEVNERGVTVKWDANGKTRTFSDREAKQELTNASEDVRKHDEQKQEQPKTKEESTADALYGVLQLQKHLEDKIDKSVDGELAELREQVKKTRRLEIKVGDKVNVVEGLKHKQLEQLITYAMMRLSPLLVGMAGTGKTHAAEQTAVAIDLPFYSMSVGAQTSKSDIIGYMSAGGTYVGTHFRQAYEHGGVFLMDEIDAGNANVLIQVNAALSNGLCAFPDAMVTRHEDFVFIASANTYGNGANRQYVGRNQLDAATLDRFAVIDWLIDDELEKNLAVGVNGKAWYMAVRACRDYVAQHSIRALISPRATQKGSKLLNVGQDLDEVIGATLLASVPEDKKADVTGVCKNIFNKFASEVKSEIPKAVNPEVSDLIR